jgi:hypothetical protein
MVAAHHPDCLDPTPSGGESIPVANGSGALSPGLVLCFESPGVVVGLLAAFVARLRKAQAPA